MSFIDVGDWTPDQVAEWLRGLDDCILPYTNFFINNHIDGCKLLTMSPDILERLNVTKIGHQEIILEGVDLLKLLHYELMNETLVQQSLRVGCRARTLFNQLKQDELNSKSERVSCATLSGVSGIMEQLKQLVSWIDRYPFSGQSMYIPIRRTILQLGIELVLTAQRDQFVDKPNVIIKNACHSLSNLCDRLVQDLHDSLSIVPAYLEVVAMKKREAEHYLGIQMNSTYNGIHMIVRVQDNSPSSRCGRIEEGDEIIQIRHQTVVGWTMNKVVRAMNDSPQGIVITFKKRPTHPSAPMPVPMLQVDDPKKLVEKRAGRSSHHGHLRGSQRNSVRSQTQTLGRHHPVASSSIQQQPLPQVPMVAAAVPSQWLKNSATSGSCRPVQVNNGYDSGMVMSRPATNGSSLTQHQNQQRMTGRERAASTTCSSSNMRDGKTAPILVQEATSTTTDQDDDDDEEAFESNYKETQLKGPVSRVHQESLYGMKPRNRRPRGQRRNTISGVTIDSPTSLTSPIRIEDLIHATSVSRGQLISGFSGVHPPFDRRLSHDTIPLSSSMSYQQDNNNSSSGHVYTNNGNNDESSCLFVSSKASPSKRSQSPASSTVSAPPLVSCSASAKIHHQNHQPQKQKDNQQLHHPLPQVSSKSKTIQSLSSSHATSCHESSASSANNNNNSVPLITSSSSSSSQVPYAKVMPLERKATPTSTPSTTLLIKRRGSSDAITMSDKSSISCQTTIPKQVMETTPQQQSQQKMQQQQPRHPVVSTADQSNTSCYQLRQSQQARRVTSSDSVQQRPQLLEEVVSAREPQSINWIYSHPNRQSPGHQINSNSTVAQNVGVVIPSNHSSSPPSAQIVSCKYKGDSNERNSSYDESSQKGTTATSSPGQIHENRLNEEARDIPPPLPLRTSSILSPARPQGGHNQRHLIPPPLPPHPSPSAQKILARATRNTSCKSIGSGDFEGWLYQRRQHPGFLVPSSKWIKRWVVLKQSFLYCFKSKESRKANTLIHLPGFVVAPATESKSKKYTFKLYTLTVAFHFATETVAEMSKWISKIGFAAITYSGMSKTIDDPYFSESDDDGDTTSDDQEEEKIQQHKRHHHSKQSKTHSRQSSNNSSSSGSSSGSKGLTASGLSKVRPPTPPKPLPRVSKIKSSPPVKPRSPGADSGISDSVHDVVTPKVVGVKGKTQNATVHSHDDMVVLDSPLIAYNHVVPKEFSSRMTASVDPKIFDDSKDCTIGSQDLPQKSPMSILDQEYNRLFGKSQGKSIERTTSSTSSKNVPRPLTPEVISPSNSASTRPMMGVSAVMKKRRAFSSVSSDRGSIEAALSLHYSSSSVHSGKSASSCYSSIGRKDSSRGHDSLSRNSPDTEEEWAHIVRTLEKVGLPAPLKSRDNIIHRRGSSASTSSSCVSAANIAAVNSRDRNSQSGQCPSSSSSNQLHQRTVSGLSVASAMTTPAVQPKPRRLLRSLSSLSSLGPRFGSGRRKIAPSTESVQPHHQPRQPQDRESFQQMVLSLRSQQKSASGEDRLNKTDSAIQDLLKEPITMNQLQSWLKKNGKSSTP